MMFKQMLVHKLFVVRSDAADLLQPFITPYLEVMLL